jgi:hypothetical protein
MTIIVASDDLRILKFFPNFSETKKMSLLAIDRASFMKNAKDLGEALVFVWYDIAGLESSPLKAALKNLGRLTVPWGIIDRKGLLGDACEAFWLGGSDYIGPRTNLETLDSARLKKALAWAVSRIPAEKPPAIAEKSVEKVKKILNVTDGIPLRENFKDSSAGWNSIKEGIDYTFAFVYVQIDRTERLLETLGENRLKALDQEFHLMIEQTFAKSGGLVWMWRDYGGLILLPFDGKVCPAILDALRLWLNRPILYANNSALSVGFTFRMAIHIGNTVFKRPGKTGELTSDALNSIFHLGARFMKNDTLYLTEEAAPFIPHKIADLFIDSGTYDGRSITRMRSFI